MLEPYRMVVVNVVASTILLGGIGTYFFLFPKKKIPFFLLLLLFSLLPLLSILRKGSYESGDFSINVIKTMAFVDSFKEGNIFPQWAESLNATYGYPLFTFTYPLPYYTTAFFHLIGFSFINSLKILLAAAFISSGAAMYYWLKREIDEKAAFFGGIFYLFAPIHLVDLHFRIAIGELMGFIFMPLCLLYITEMISSTKNKYIILFGISLGLLILSHQAISLSFFPVIVVYGGLKSYLKKSITGFLKFIYGLSLGLGLSAFYWVPVILMGKYTGRDLQNNQVSFPLFHELFYSNWRFGFLFQGPHGELSFIVGYTQWIVILSCLFLLLLHKISKKYLYLTIFFLCIFISYFFMMTTISSFIWNSIRIIRNFQFAYRLLVPTALSTSVLAAIVLSNIKSKYLVYGIVLLTILYTILNWGNRRVIPVIDDNYLRHELPLSTYQAEGLSPAIPRWTNSKDIWMKKIPPHHLEVLNGSATVNDVSRTSTNHEYIVLAKSNAELKENTLYFPGWEIYANGIPLKMDYVSNDYPGIIRFNLPKGLYFVKLQYNLIPIQLVSIGISIFYAFTVALTLFTNALRFKK